MPKNYTDFVNAMSKARSEGYSVRKLVLTEESIQTFMTDGKFTEAAETKHDKLGDFEVSVERGDGNYVLTESGVRFIL